jgi:hypothetical protein
MIPVYAAGTYRVRTPVASYCARSAGLRWDPDHCGLLSEARVLFPVSEMPASGRYMLTARSVWLRRLHTRRQRNVQMRRRIITAIKLVAAVSDVGWPPVAVIFAYRCRQHGWRSSLRIPSVISDCLCLSILPSACLHTPSLSNISFSFFLQCCVWSHTSYFSHIKCYYQSSEWTGIPYRNFFFTLNFLPALINICYIHLPFLHFSGGVSLFRF